ncbi:hypothetical protein [Acetobacter malorum]|uniref:hypothetical protein n=1 Tax=Acetobacter malorum TaxID=178901 RepID=UPI0018D3FFEA|nr:hypothetical protein [Acetobacter malorum]
MTESDISLRKTTLAATNPVISSGSVKTITSGNSSVSGTILSGGVENVLSGGVVKSTTVSSGGTLLVASGSSYGRIGGIAINTTVKDGGSAIINHNGAEIVSAGTDHGVTLSTGYLDIRAGGTAIQYNAKNATYIGITSGGTSLSGIVDHSYEWVGSSYYESYKGSAAKGVAPL